MNDTLHPDDPRAHFANAVRTTGALLADLRPEQLELPTPCPAFDVRALAGHLVTVLRRVAALGAGTDPLAMPNVSVVAGDAWHEAWLAGAHEVQAAWTDPAVLTRDMVLPWAAAPGAAMLIRYAGEVTVHTWDLATALGVPAGFDDATVELALAAARRSMPAGDREAAFAEVVARLPAGTGPIESPFGNPVELDADAPAIDQLVAWYGRRP
jgi:uncharacterized protein (TIGR03086 family)